MKDFVLFAGNDYYAEGGWLDFAGTFDTAEEASTKGAWLCNKYQSSKFNDWWHVVQLSTGKMVEGVSGGYTGQIPRGLVEDSSSNG